MRDNDESTSSGHHEIVIGGTSGVKWDDWENESVREHSVRTLVDEG